jgi:hypothetical protein
MYGDDAADEQSRVAATAVVAVGTTAWLLVDGGYRGRRRRGCLVVGRRRWWLRSGGGAGHVAMSSHAETAAPTPETNHWPRRIGLSFLFCGPFL